MIKSLVRLFIVSRTNLANIYNKKIIFFMDNPNKISVSQDRFIRVFINNETIKNFSSFSTKEQGNRKTNLL